MASSETQQEKTPLTGEKAHEEPSVTRDSSLIQQISHFIGIADTLEEKINWDAKRLRHIENRYKVIVDEVNKYAARHRSIEAETPLSFNEEDAEKGTRALPTWASIKRAFGQPKTSVGNYQILYDTLPQPQRESIPSAIFNSFSNLLKKGTPVSKKRVNFQKSFAAKCKLRSIMVAYAVNTIEHPDEASLQPETDSMESTASVQHSAIENSTSSSENFDQLDDSVDFKTEGLYDPMPSLRSLRSLRLPDFSTEFFFDFKKHNSCSPDNVQPEELAPSKITPFPIKHCAREELTRKFARKVHDKIKRVKANLWSKTDQFLAMGVDERPWFTYWISTVQTFVCILSLLFYGFAPFALEMREARGDVMDITLSSRRVAYLEQSNPWFGPHYADLIRLGAVYSPCMRRELEMWKAIEEDRRIENKTGCCITNDRSGCYQSSESICPRTMARWIRWDKPLTAASKKNFLTHESKTIWTQPRKSGAVCGQDPSYCRLPLSVAPYEWPDDSTQWPICRENHNGPGLPEHLTCQITGRPCCIQFQGLCRIATKEYCDFVQGIWHENATLCSQVNCFLGICGMIPFFSGDNPNQIYRLFTSLFIHAGVIHLALSMAFQMYFMAYQENLIGSKRMAILYFASGISGNLASAIFVPYYPTVGPSSAQCGVFSSVVVELWHFRHLLDPFELKFQSIAHLIVTLLVLCIGLIPWIDNWSHLFGTIFGLITSIIVYPYMDFGDKDYDPLLQYISSTVPKSPLVQRGSMSTIINIADMRTAQGYGQWANAFPYRGDQGRTPVFTAQFYVFISAIVFSILLSILLVVFFGNVKIDCPWCTHFNCLPVFQCHNLGLKLKKWLPI